MARDLIPEFSIGDGPSEPADPAVSRDVEERAFGLRVKLEHYYTRMREAEKSGTAARKKSAQSRDSLLRKLLDVADSLDDFFRSAQESRKLRKQKEAREAMDVTYDILLDILKEQGLYQVDVIGKRYRNVEFNGQIVPEPWEVVGVDSNRQESEERGGAVKKVLRSLWVHVSQNRVTVFRRAKVIC